MSYSWGDDSGSKSGGKSGKSDMGYDYKSAKKAYGEDLPPVTGSGTMHSSLGSSKSRAKSYRAGKTPAPVGKDIQTTSKYPIAVSTDVTGSMSSWPGILFEKLPLLGVEVEHYAKDYAISFSAFGDYNSDTYPLQVRDFDNGKELDGHIEALYPEGGGGDDPEDPQAVAYYYLNHCKIDKAVKPFFFFITDTTAHNTLTAGAVERLTGDKGQPYNSKELFKKLAEKFTVYVLLKGEVARSYWEDIFGAQKVKTVEEPRDIVELIIACIADEMGEIKDYEMRSSKRHEDKPDRVERVMKSVKADKPEDKPAEDGKAAKVEDGSKSSKSKSMKSKKLV